jgi:O-antigen/teichoic acid export membrane protein
VAAAALGVVALAADPAIRHLSGADYLPAVPIV